MNSSEDYYHIGLGKHFLVRAGFIFSILTILFIGSVTTVVYASVKSGSFNKYVKTPIKNFGYSFQKSLEQSVQTTPSENSNFENNENVNVEIVNDATPSATSVPQQKTQYYYVQPTIVYTQPNTKSYEEALKEQEEWSKQQAAKNQQWYNDQNAKNDAEYQKKYEDAVKQQQAELEKWKQENGF